MKPQRMFAMVVEDHIIEVAPTEARAYGKIHPVMVVPLAQWEAMERVINEARNMTAAQLDSLERQFLKKRLFEHYQLPRLSLFYL